MTSLLTNTALNNEQITDLLDYYGKPCKFILYGDMDEVKNINELLPRTLILYQLREIGHFTCVFENKEGINFFDPLGYCIDDELKLIEPGYVYKDHQDKPYLLKLFLQANKPIVWSNHRLQKSQTSTCGHWNSVRMLWENLGEHEFLNCFKGVEDRDETTAKIFNTFENNIKK